MSALIGALRVSLSAETSQFEAGMKRAQRQTQASATAMQRSMGLVRTGLASLAAGLSIGLFAGAVKSALEYAGTIAEVARTLGVTTRDLQTFRFAAQQTGVSQDILEVGLRRLTVTMGKAELGSTAQAKAFGAIGISVDQLKGKDTGEVFRMMADGLSKVTDRSQRAAVEMILMGRSGSMLDNLLAPGSARLNALAEAAQQLGIVLSDDQIQKAEQTAHKLEALKTVLSASIAGIVADNSDAIIGLANSLGYLVSKIGESLKGWRILTTEIKAFWNADPFHGQNPLTAPDKAVSVMQFHDRLTASLAGKATAPKPTGGDLGKFLGGGGGGGRARGGGAADHSAQDALNESNRFDQDLRRAQIDVLHATQDLAKDYIERGTIGLKIIDAEDAAFVAEQAYQVALYKLTNGKEGLSKEQSAQLTAEHNKTVSLQKDAVWQQLNEQRAADINMLEQHDFDRRKDVLQSQEQIATTAGERRNIELALLEIAYQQKKQALEYVIETSKDIAAVEDARRDLENLKKTHASDKQGVLDNTRNPLEEWKATVPQTAAEITAALQSIEANGLDGIAQAIGGIVSGTEGMKSAFHQLAQSILADITQMIVKMLVFKAIQAITGAIGGGGNSAFGDGSFQPMSVDIGSTAPAPIPHFAKGGSMILGGNAGTDRNVISMNGLPIARVSKGEALHFDPNGGGMGDRTVVVNNFQLHSPVVTSDLLGEMDARAKVAAEAGARLGVSKVLDMNQRSFGRAQRV